MVRKYPWTDWLKRDKVSMTRTKDFTCMPHVMAQQIRNFARQYGLKVSVRIEEDTLEVVWQSNAAQRARAENSITVMRKMKGA